MAETEPELELEEYTPRVPDHMMTDEEVESLEVEYSTRAPEDFVVSGPLTSRDGAGPGRRFHDIAGAMVWATRKYGRRLLKRIEDAETGGRWAFLIRGVRT